MPQIIVAADRGAAFGEGDVTFRERVNVADFESGHFAAQLVERLGWAVEDADVVERRQAEPGERDGHGEPAHDRQAARGEGEALEASKPTDSRPADSAAVPA